MRGSFCEWTLNAELSCGGDTFANHADGLQERLSAAEGTSLNQFINVAIVGRRREAIGFGDGGILPGAGRYWEAQCVFRLP
jgi:hypothetical protein